MCSPAGASPHSHKLPFSSSEPRDNNLSKLGEPAWDNSNVYAGFDDEKYKSDLSAVTGNIKKLLALAEAHIAPNLEQLGKSKQLSTVLASLLVAYAKEINPVLRNLEAYASCELYVDTGDKRAKTERDTILNVVDSYNAGAEILMRALRSLDSEQFRILFSSKDLAEFEVFFKQLLAKQPLPLPLEQEKELAIHERQELVAPAHKAQNQIRPEITIPLNYGSKQRILRLSQAQKLLQEDPEEPRRHAIYQAQKVAFEQRQDELAQILVSMVSFKVQTEQLRAAFHKVEPNFLRNTLAHNRLEQETLESAMGAIRDNLENLQQVPALMARALGQRALAPSDLLGPAPILAGSKAPEPISFREALELVKGAAQLIGPEAADFIDLAYQKNWIEALQRPSKVSGSNTPSFANPREPRVLMTYTGGSKSVFSLAHELLGHAFQSYQLRDLPWVYPDNMSMSAHEIVSNVAETALQKHMANRVLNGNNAQAKLDIMWEEMKHVLRLLIHIPCLFEFEDDLHKQVAAGKTFGAQDLSNLMAEKNRIYFGNTLSEPDSIAWATRLHFYFPKREWDRYTYPYTLGFQSADYVFAKREEWGEEFYPRYLAMQRDMPFLNLEDLMLKHLQVDIRKPYLWNTTINRRLEVLAPFAALLDELGL